jgi:hypothetical protein
MTMLAVAERPRERLDAEPSLAAMVGTLWEELQAGRPVACPLCHGELAPQYGPHASPVGGRCRSCGTALG